MEKTKKKICWIRVFKNLSYFMIPILLVLLLACIISLICSTDSMRRGETYFESVDFADSYSTSLKNAINEIESINSVYYDLTLEYGEELYGDRLMYGYHSYHLISEEDYDSEVPIYYMAFQSNFNYLIIDHENGAIYTNLEDNVANNKVSTIKSQILSSSLYWKCVNGKVDTSIDKLKGNMDATTSFYREYLKDGKYEIYTCMLEDVPNYDSYFSRYWVYNTTLALREWSIYLIPTIIILFCVMIFVILLGIGHTSREEGIHLDFLDKWSLEIVILLSIPFFMFSFILCFIGVYNEIIIALIALCMGLGTFYVVNIVLLETIVKRLKTHTFIETTFVYWIYKQIKEMMENTKVSLRVSILFIGFIIANWLIYVLFRRSVIGAICLMILYVLTFSAIIRGIVAFKKLKKALEEIYKGNTDIHLDTSKFKGEMKQIAIYINDIAGGLSNAVAEQLKSERLKTELITNVSHDIKTPLTSIINYVDLLKRDGITNEKAKEYLTILDNKSQRLKKLTEDLVEASKASSGNIKLNKEKLEINELIKQVSGEFEDKFKVNHLEEIITFSEKPIYIYADNRYMYRILENMYSNVSKYALDNTRVYTDIIDQGEDVIIQIKNISKEKLNITADELMQRFVRGDVSRNTEGSGLGLSIATSLTELQGGKFNIYLDGDLFKITIEFEKMK